MPSAVIQDAVASVIREVIYFDADERITSSLELLEVTMQIFMISSQAAAISHCIYTFLETCRFSSSDELGLLRLIKRNNIKFHKKLFLYLNSRSAPTVSDPVCRFLDHLFHKAPKLTFAQDLHG